MSTFLSSIFSFSTLQLEGTRKWSTLRAIVVCAALLFAAEMVCRFAVAPIGESWEYWHNGGVAEKFIWYRELALHRATPRIVIAGDSTAFRTFSPGVFSSSSDDVTACNLGSMANFPLSFVEIAMPVFQGPYQPPEVLVVSFNPESFLGGAKVEWHEAQIKSSVICRRKRDEVIIGDFVYMARIRPAAPFVKSWFTGDGLGETPSDNGAKFLTGVKPGGLQWDEHSKTNHRSLHPNRIDVLRQLGQLAYSRGFRFVVMLPPRFEPPERRVAVEEDFLKVVGELAGEEKVTLKILDCRNVEGITKKHFWDVGHLNREGAVLVSQHMAMLYNRGEL